MNSCSNTSDGSGITDDRLKVGIVLVHGTFAAKSEFSDPLRNPIALHLKQSLQFDLELHGHRWSGNNSHEDRVTASERLSTEINTWGKTGRWNVCVIIGHSHGGNVGLYASRDIQFPVILITIATPFFVIHRRPKIVNNIWTLWKASTFSAIFILSLGYLALMFQLPNIIFDFIPFTGYLVLLFTLQFLGQSQSDFVSENQLSTQFYNQFVQDQNHCERIIVVRTRLDEALFALRISFVAFEFLPFMLLMAVTIAFGHDLYIACQFFWNQEWNTRLPVLPPLWQISLATILTAAYGCSALITRFAIGWWILLLKRTILGQYPKSFDNLFWVLPTWTPEQYSSPIITWKGPILAVFSAPSSWARLKPLHSVINSDPNLHVTLSRRLTDEINRMKL